MGRKSTARHCCGCPRKGCGLLGFASLFLISLLSGCTPRIHPETARPDPLDSALLTLLQGKEYEAVSQLGPLLTQTAYQCQAAFYLFALNGSEDEYLEILRTERCRKHTPAHARLVERLVNSEEELGQCLGRLKGLEKELNGLKQEKAALTRDTVVLEKELARLRFEVEKMEEIRRETEQWRVK